MADKKKKKANKVKPLIGKAKAKNLGTGGARQAADAIRKRNEYLKSI